MNRILGLLATFLVVTLAPAADNWPQFRGPNGDGIADAKTIPIEFNETKNVRWKTPIHGKGWSSPVVWGNQVWVTTVDEVMSGKDVAKATFFAVCVDRTTGKIIHDIKLWEEDKPAFCHPFNSYASPTPAIEDGRVYVHFGSHGTACLDTATGKVLWERRDLKCDHFRGPGSSVTLFGNKLYLIYDGFDLQYVACLDKATGKTIWKKDRNIKYSTTNGDYYKAYATPAIVTVDGKPQVICPSAEETISHDPETGEELWRIRHGGMNNGAKVVAGHGMFYLLSGHPAKLLAVKQDIKGEVSPTSVVWNSAKFIPSRPSLLLTGDLLFFVDNNGTTSCVDAKTGKVHWQERLPAEFSASPILVNGNLYFCGQDGKVFVVPAKTEYEQIAVNRLDDGFMASPAVAGEQLFLRTKSHLYMISK